MYVTINAKIKQLTKQMFQVLLAKLRNVEKTNDYSSVEPEVFSPLKQEHTSMSKTLCNIP